MRRPGSTKISRAMARESGSAVDWVRGYGLFGWRGRRTPDPLPIGVSGRADARPQAGPDSFTLKTCGRDNNIEGCANLRVRVEISAG
jgi:hypothetical protein